MPSRTPVPVLKYAACLVLFGAGLWLLGGCETPVEEHVRDNPNDPKSGRFVPDGPSGLALSSEENVAILAWGDNTDFEDGYLVEKALGEGPFEELAVLPPNTTSYLHEQPPYTFAHDLTYRVRLFLNHAGERITLDVPAQDFPTISTFSPGTPLLTFPDEETISVTWEDRSPFETGFILERKNLEYPYDIFVSVAELGPNTEQYTEALALQNGLSYEYRVRARDAESTSPPVASELTYFSITTPALRLLDQPGQYVSLQWDHDHPLTTGYLIERALSEGTYEVIAELPAEARTYEDHSADLSLAYLYRVRTHASDADAISVQYLPYFQTVRSVSEHQHPPLVLAFSSDGALLATARGDSWQGDASVTVWETATGRQVHRFTHSGLVWDVDSGEEVRRLSTYYWPGTFALSPDESRVAAGYSDCWQSTNLYDASSGQQLYYVRGGCVEGFSPDGTVLAAKGSVGDLWFWTGDSGTFFTYLAGHAVAFHPGGVLIAVSREDGSVALQQPAGQRWIERPYYGN